MKTETVKMTTAGFAKLHGVNKRTLHYYDNIGLFSPCYKDEKNNYRYYDYLQSIDFEYIRMLKELNLSIEEIKEFLRKPNGEDFVKLADIKIKEIDGEIGKLKEIGNVLNKKKKQLELCREIKDMDIRIVECEEEAYWVTPFDFDEENVQEFVLHVKDVWNIEQYRMGIGSYISVEKIKKRNYEKYDGLFVPAAEKGRGQDIAIRPKGTYLYAYLKGDWDRLPELYEAVLKYADAGHINLVGCAYEIGLNDFAISGMEEYITQVMIKVEKAEID